MSSEQLFDPILAATEELERSATNIRQIHSALKSLTAENLKSLEANSQRIQQATAQLKLSHEQKTADFLAYEAAMREIDTGKQLLDKNKQLLGIAEEKLKTSAESLYQSGLLLAVANSQALLDHLTKLPNRRLFIDRFNQTILAGHRNKTYSSLLFLDLDNFKLINDRYGHEVGDLLLIEVAERLTSAVRDTDTVARYGGDEFVIIISNLNIDQKAAVARTELIVEKVLKSIATPFTMGVGDEAFVLELQCTTSIGVTVFLYEAGDPKSVLDNIISLADKAMYQAKQAGGNQSRFDVVTRINRERCASPCPTQQKTKLPT
jgi:diguanylate cyclase (GGDEF)-like protein